MWSSVRKNFLSFTHFAAQRASYSKIYFGTINKHKPQAKSKQKSEIISTRLEWLKWRAVQIRLQDFFSLHLQCQRKKKPENKLKTMFPETKNEQTIIYHQTHLKVASRIVEKLIHSVFRAHASETLFAFCQKLRVSCRVFELFPRQISNWYEY